MPASAMREPSDARHLRVGRFLCLLATLSAAHADPVLDEALDAIAPDIPKWATVCLVHDRKDGPTFEWHDYRDTGTRSDFWPASTIKLFTAVAALEKAHTLGLPLNTTVQFEHEQSGTWRLDCARTLPEMLSEVFRRSSNEDYTLLLRVCGIDWLNGTFLTPERGFQNSALMRGYVRERPWTYIREEAQRLRFFPAESATPHSEEHRWSGRSWSEERGCTVIDAQTGNVTTPHDLANCLRRLLFHRQLDAKERFRLPDASVDFLLHGGDGFTGLETRHPDSGPYAWKGLEKLFPKARFYHKCGVISDHALEVACLDDRAQGGPCFILVPVVRAGHASQPVRGEELVAQMSEAIGRWVLAKRKAP